mmetsp:Transcript_89967/g.196960  ORF Transcript_89967/g.196960 Transcript_89967/m.196960 type:complete len:136 (-) Transcript_89967:1744-2151(-)
MLPAINIDYPSFKRPSGEEPKQPKQQIRRPECFDAARSSIRWEHITGEDARLLASNQNHVHAHDYLLHLLQHHSCQINCEATPEERRWPPEFRIVSMNFRCCFACRDVSLHKFLKPLSWHFLSFIAMASILPTCS